MNISLFKEVLKSEALNCYDSVMHSYNNHPFATNDNITNDIIEFELKQKLGAKAYSSIMTPYLTKEQFVFMKSLVDNYKKRIETKLLIESSNK